MNFLENKIKEENIQIKATLEATNKRLDDINLHLVDQSRRIDETNKKIDEVRIELTGRIDETNKKIDAVRTELTGRIEDVRTDLTGRIDETRAELKKLVLSGDYEIINTICNDDPLKVFERYWGNCSKLVRDGYCMNKRNIV